MPSNNNNNNNNRRGNNHNRNIRFNHRIHNGRIQLNRHQHNHQPRPRNSHNQQNNPQNQFRNQNNMNTNMIRRTIFNNTNNQPFNNPGVPQRQFNGNQMERFQQNRPYGHGHGQASQNFNPNFSGHYSPNTHNNSGRSFRNSRFSPGVIGMLEPDGSFVPMDPQGLFHYEPRNAIHEFGGQPPSPLFPPGAFFAGRSYNPNNPSKRGELCKYYAGVNGCRHGDQCQFMHEDFPCKAYHVLGDCSSGEECKFSHERLCSWKKGILASHVASGVEGFQRMSRSQVLAAVNEQERKHGQTNDGFIIDSASPQLEQIGPRSTAFASGHTPEKKKEEKEEQPKESSGDSFEKVDPAVPEVVPTAGDPPGPTIHQIVQLMRQMISDTKKETKEKEKEGSSSKENSGGNGDEKGTQFTKVARTIQVSLTIQNPGSSSDSPTFRSVANTASTLGTKRQSRIVPSLDSIISGCIGHGPPFTSWQMCQIYNSCAEAESNVSLTDLIGFLPDATIN